MKSHLSLNIKSFRVMVIKLYAGRAVAQAVSRWLPTAGVRVRVQAGM
jgi:hypothetical protein